MQRIKCNDTVIIITGKDKGKKGQVIEILPKKDKVMVKGVALATKHFKAKKQGQTSSIKKTESYIDASNAMTICPSCKKPTRIGISVTEQNKKSRVCKRCNEQF